MLSGELKYLLYLFYITLMSSPLAGPSIVWWLPKACLNTLDLPVLPRFSACSHWQANGDGKSLSQQLAGPQLQARKAPKVQVAGAQWGLAAQPATYHSS